MKEKIYLLPGLMCDERLWERLIPFVENEYELIPINIPLSSDFDEIINSIDTLLEDEKVNLLGFSLGAYIASYYAIKYPHRVKKLFLIAGTPSAMTQEEIVKRNNMLELMDTLGFNAISYKKVVSLLEETNQNDKKLIQLIQDMYVDLGEQVYKSQIQTVNNRISLEQQLLDLKEVPIRFFYSTDDRLLNYDSLNEFKAHYTHITTVSREGTSHMIPLEFPEILSKEIQKWMNDVKD
jgi:pimeloyl-ACP methyl ester carboxylesterase